MAEQIASQALSSAAKAGCEMEKLKTHTRKKINKKTAEQSIKKEILSKTCESKQTSGDKVQVYLGEEDTAEEEELEYVKEDLAADKDLDCEKKAEDDEVDEKVSFTEKLELDQGLESKEEVLKMEPDDVLVKDLPQETPKIADTKEMCGTEDKVDLGLHANYPDDISAKEGAGDMPPSPIIYKTQELPDPVTIVIEEPTLIVIEEPTPIVIEEPTPIVIEEPTPIVIEEPTPIVIEEPTPIGLTPAQESFLKEIVPDVYASILKFESEEEEEGISKSCCSCCWNICCQTCKCNLSSMLPRSSERKAPEMEKEELFTPTLQKAALIGMGMIKKAVFPLVLAMTREIWVTLELSTVLLGLILSVVALSFDNNEVFNIIHFVLIVISSTLAIIDAVYSLMKCQSCRICYSYIRNRDKHDVEGTEETRNRCLKCLYWCHEKMDIARMILTEVLVYPLLICDIFEVIVGRSFESDSHSDRLGFALFLLSCISLLLYVYVVRVIVLGRSIKRLQEMRTNKGQPDTGSARSAFSILSGAFWYQMFFFLHIVLQMMAQIMMLVAIGGKIRYDNRHFYQRDNSNEVIQYSLQLIIMLVIGYVSPTFGYLSFFIVTKPWAQEFPLGIFNDITSQLKLLASGGPDSYLSSSDDLNDEVNKNIIKTLGENYKKLSRKEIGKRLIAFIKKFGDDFEKLRQMSFLSKFGYPFKNPWLVLLCLFYAGMQFTFVICAGVTMNDMGILTSQILNGGGWIFYYIIAIAFGVIANAYAFLVAAFWIFIIATIIAIIIGVILYCILICVCAITCAASGSSSSSNNR